MALLYDDGELVCRSVAQARHYYELAIGVCLSTTKTATHITSQVNSSSLTSGDDIAIETTTDLIMALEEDSDRNTKHGVTLRPFALYKLGNLHHRLGEAGV